jgi:hypothetical protein
MSFLRKPCEERDADLLLMVHEELDPLATLSIRGHLLHCERCRQRMAQFTAVSATMTSATAAESFEGFGNFGDGGGAGSGTGRFSFSQPYYVSFLVLTIIVSVFTAILPWLPEPSPVLNRPASLAEYAPSQNGAVANTGEMLPAAVSGIHGTVVPSPRPKRDRGCAPGLPNDRCR